MKLKSRDKTFTTKQKKTVFFIVRMLYSYFKLFLFFRFVLFCLLLVVYQFSSFFLLFFIIVLNVDNNLRCYTSLTANKKNEEAEREKLFKFIGVNVTRKRNCIRKSMESFTTEIHSYSRKLIRFFEIINDIMNILCLR